MKATTGRHKTGRQGTVRMRRAERGDGARLHEFVLASTLETNSRYAYLLLSSHFRDTCLVAERDDEIVGFVAGYILPRRPDTLFVWQVGVAPSARRTGLAKAMLRALLCQRPMSGVRCLEATVARSNDASARLFASLATLLDTTFSKHRGFAASEFGEEVHEDEVLVRVGPWEVEK